MSSKPARSHKNTTRTTRVQWTNIAHYLARYAALILVMFGATEGFRRIIGTTAPFELNFVYFPLFFIAITALFGIIHFNKIKTFVFSQNWLHTIGLAGLGIWNIAIYAWLKYNANPVWAVNNPLAYLLLQGLFYCAGFALLGIATFGFPFVVTFQKELLLISIVAVPYISLTLLLRSYWHIFSALVVQANTALMSIITPNFAHTTGSGDPTLALESFQVIIGAPCSGVDSLLLFTGLYWFVALLDFELYTKWKLLILFPLGLIGTFAMSILRIFALMLIGAFHSAEFALGAFHTNAGWIIFVIYFLTFIYFAMPWLKK